MRWTQIPVLIKIFKLIIYEYGDYIEANSAEEDVEVVIFYLNIRIQLKRKSFTKTL